MEGEGERGFILSNIWNRAIRFSQWFLGEVLARLFRRMDRGSNGGHDILMFAARWLAAYCELARFSVFECVKTHCRLFLVIQIRGIMWMHEMELYRIFSRAYTCIDSS